MTTVDYLLLVVYLLGAVTQYLLINATAADKYKPPLRFKILMSVLWPMVILGIIVGWIFNRWRRS